MLDDQSSPHILTLRPCYWPREFSISRQDKVRPYIEWLQGLFDHGDEDEGEDQDQEEDISDDDFYDLNADDDPLSGDVDHCTAFLSQTKPERTPTPAPETPSSEKAVSPEKLINSIDYGTTTTGVAFASPSHQKPDLLDPILSSLWCQQGAATTSQVSVQVITIF
jgi:hypothetical protein